jgi:hypothetical protein
MTRLVKLFKHEFFERFELPSETINECRYYTTPTGEKYPSVTTVIGKYSDKRGLYEWRKRVGETEANRISAFASSRGTRIHNVLEKYVLNDPTYMDGVMPTNKVMVNDMKKILDENVDEVYGIEHPLYSHKLRTAGKTDLIARFNKIKSIVDFKTASRTKREEDILGYFLQSACYAMMVSEKTGVSIPQIVILIGVDADCPQLFVKKTIDYVPAVVKMFKNHTISTLY